MFIVVLALLALAGCGDTVENYYSLAQPDAASTTPDAAPDTAVDTSEPDTSEPDTYAPPDTAVDTWTADTYVPDTAKPDTYVPDTYVPPVDAGPVGILPCTDRFVVIGPDALGNGLFVDTQTGLTWTRNQQMKAAYYAAKDHCAAIGMRLPAKSEALGIVKAPPCAIPDQGWATWTALQDWVMTVVVYDGSEHVVSSNTAWMYFCVK